MVHTGRSPRIFLGPLEIAGYYGNLERGFVERGIDARLVTLHPHPFDFTQARRNPWPARLSQWAVLRHRTAAAPVRLLTGSLYILACLLLLVWSLPRFDTYIFSWGTTFLPGNLDLPFLRLLRKRTVVVLGHGSEARPPYMSTPDWQGAPDDAALDRLAAQTSAVANRVQRVERWATHVIGLGTTGQFFTGPFVDFYALGIPTPPAPMSEPTAPSDDIVVLHVPSKPEVKGTAHIRAAMADVVERHPAVRYVELSGRPHEEILAAMAGATFIVDQLWSDIPMAVVGTEAAALGRATVIGGYAWQEYERTLAPEATPPTVMTTPDDLVATVEGCIRDIAAMKELGSAARSFIESRWSPASVAGNYLRVLDGTRPTEWVLGPADVRYGYGCGVSHTDVELMVHGLTQRFGAGALRWPAAAEVYRLTVP